MQTTLVSRIVQTLERVRSKGARSVSLRATTVEGEPVAASWDRTELETWDLPDGALQGMAQAIESMAREQADELGGGLRAFVITAKVRKKKLTLVRSVWRFTVRGSYAAASDESASPSGQILQQMRHGEELHTALVMQGAETWEAMKEARDDARAEAKRWQARAEALEKTFDGMAEKRLQLAETAEKLLDRVAERDVLRERQKLSIDAKRKVLNEILVPVGAPLLTRVANSLLGGPKEAAQAAEEIAIIDQIVRSMTPEKFKGLSQVTELTDGDRVNIARLLSMRSKTLKLATEGGAT